jgi:hypothetical protein
VGPEGFRLRYGLLPPERVAAVTGGAHPEPRLGRSVKAAEVERNWLVAAKRS